MKRFSIIGSFLIVLCALGANASESMSDETSPVILKDSIVVKGVSHTAVAKHKVASSVSVITADEMQQKQITNVADGLRRTYGLDIVRSGGAGTSTSLPRLQGTVGTTGTDLLVNTVTFTALETRTISNFSVGMPEE